MSFNPENYFLKRMGNCNFKVHHRNYSFSKSETLFGRGRDCDVILKNMRCSLIHCKITFENGRIFIEDFSSAGTFVNNEKLNRGQKVELFENSTIGMGADPNRPDHVDKTNFYIYKVQKVEAPIILDSSDEDDVEEPTVSIPITSSTTKPDENQNLEESMSENVMDVGSDDSNDSDKTICLKNDENSEDLTQKIDEHLSITEESKPEAVELDATIPVRTDDIKLENDIGPQIQKILNLKNKFTSKNRQFNQSGSDVGGSTSADLQPEWISSALIPTADSAVSLKDLVMESRNLGEDCPNLNQDCQGLDPECQDSAPVNQDSAPESQDFNPEPPIFAPGLSNFQPFPLHLTEGSSLKSSVQSEDNQPVQLLKVANHPNFLPNPSKLTQNSTNSGENFGRNSAQIPTNSAQIPANSAQIPSNSVQKPINSAQKPFDQKSLNSAQILTNSAQIPTNSAQIPSNFAQKPSNSAQKSFDQKSSNSVQISANSAQIPSNSAQKPSNSVQISSNLALKKKQNPASTSTSAASNLPNPDQQTSTLTPEQIKSKTNFLRHYGQQCTKLIDVPDSPLNQTADLLDEIATPNDPPPIFWINGHARLKPVRKPKRKRGRPKKPSESENQSSGSKKSKSKENEAKILKSKNSDTKQSKDQNSTSDNESSATESVSHSSNASSPAKLKPTARKTTNSGSIAPRISFSSKNVNKVESEGSETSNEYQSAKSDDFEAEENLEDEKNPKRQKIEDPKCENQKFYFETGQLLSQKEKLEENGKDEVPKVSLRTYPGSEAKKTTPMSKKLEKFPDSDEDELEGPKGVENASEGSKKAENVGTAAPKGRRIIQRRESIIDIKKLKNPAKNIKNGIKNYVAAQKRQSLILKRLPDIPTPSTSNDNPSTTNQSPNTKQPFPQSPEKAKPAFQSKFPHLYQSLVDNEASAAPSTSTEPKKTNLIKTRRNSVFDEQAKLIPNNLPLNERSNMMRHWNQNTTKLIDMPAEDPSRRRRGRPKLNEDERIKALVEKSKGGEEKK